MFESKIFSIVGTKTRGSSYLLCLTLCLFLSLPAHNFVISFDQRLYYDEQNKIGTDHRVYANNSLIYGKQYSDWTAEWWKWAYSIPKNVHPAYDDYGYNCHVNQSSPVWFFPGSFNHSTTRYCIVPSDVSILIPILNTECSYIEYPFLKSDDELRKCAKLIQDHVNVVNSTLDGKIIPYDYIIRTQSQLFNFTLPNHNILDINGNIVSQAISDGTWIFLQPLSVGTHTIKFKGDFESNAKNQFNDGTTFAIPLGWNYETTYELVVLPQKNF